MLAGPRKLDFLYTNFSPDYPPISILFSIEKHPILSKLDVFYNNLLKFNLGSFVSDENPPIAIPNFAKKRPKRQAHNRPTYTMSMCSGGARGVPFCTIFFFLGGGGIEGENARGKCISKNFPKWLIFAIFSSKGGGALASDCQGIPLIRGVCLFFQKIKNFPPSVTMMLRPNPSPFCSSLFSGFEVRFRGLPWKIFGFNHKGPKFT